MSLDIVLEKIRSSAVGESRKLEDEAEAQAQKRISDARIEAERILAKARADTDRKIASLKKSELAAASRNLKLRLLTAKNQEVEAVFAQALARLSAMSSQERKGYYAPFLKNARRSVDGFYLHCSKLDAPVFSELEPSLEVLADIDSAGFVLENRQRTVRVDYTFERLLQQVKPLVQDDLLSVLFKHEG
jgi:vacuolar-type H+-ATPase subunit E/Vma4